MALIFLATAVVVIGGLAVTVSQQAAFADLQPINPKKVTICHDGETVTVAAGSVAGHVRNHGDTIGACQPEP